MNFSRREFLRTTGLATLATTSGCLTPHGASAPAPVLVNDVHTQLNPTLVRGISAVQSQAELKQIIRRAGREHRPVSIAGGRHATGAQQFAADVELIDTRNLRRILSFDTRTGTVEVETGIQWPDLLGFLASARNGQTQGWTVAQKQTGTDRLSIGGALAANAHGRGLNLPPFISSVESFVLIDARGEAHTCSRQENAELFRLVIGGYGLFGFVYSAKLRLAPLRKLRRVVQMLDMAEVPGAFADRIRNGFLYGDCQFAIDSKSDEFLRRSLMTCYEPVPEDTPMTAAAGELSEQEWKTLIYLAHVDPTRAFNLYAQHYLATSGRICTSESQYRSDYFDNYHREIDTKLHANEPGSEVISELYVPRPMLPQFFAEAGEELRRSQVPLVYGNIRLIERDTESFLAWARQSYACVIFNLHTPHTTDGIDRTATTFRRLIDLTIRYQGSYYLTYHRYATREQVLACYPQFPEFLRLKRTYDPEERFQSDWYRHYRKLMADG